MKSKDLSSLPPEIANCYRVFLVRHSHHWNATEWTMDELWGHMVNTISYEDGDRDFKKMLPSFFELVWREVEREAFPDLWPLTPLRNHKWRQWPDDERNSSGLLWRLALEQSSGWSLYEILSTAQHIELSWFPFLQLWFASPLSAWLLEDAVPVKRWDDLPPEARDWLCLPRVLARIEADLFRSESEDAKQIAHLFDTITFHCARQST